MALLPIESDPIARALVETLVPVFRELHEDFVNTLTVQMTPLILDALLAHTNAPEVSITRNYTDRRMQLVVTFDPK